VVAHRKNQQQQALRGGSRRIRLAGISSLLLFLLAGCSKNSGSPSATSPEPARTAAVSDPQPVELDACTLLSAADAARILGVAVRPITNVGGCSYEAAAATTGGWRPHVALNVRKYKSAAEESSAWDDLKLIRHLQPGRKNLAVVNGIGTEAYLETIPDGGFVEASIIVHKDSSDFRVIEVTGERANPEALQAVAQQVANRLP